MNEQRGRALIANGTGRYADPWHPYADTSPLLAGILDGAGFHVEVDDDVDRAMTRLDGIDLLVVNAGDPWREGGESGAPDAATSGFSTAVERGIGILAVHAALSSLRDYPDWGATIGGRWTPGASWHPPIGETQVTGDVLPDRDRVEGFDVFDERYLGLELIGESHTVAWHEHEGTESPAAWVRTVGRSRAAVDTLGHDTRSYDSAGHRALITQLARWLTEPRGA